MAKYKNPLVWYVYDSTPKGGKQLRGCVVKTPEGKLGYSWASKMDLKKVTKKLTRAIALGRAEKCDLSRVMGTGDGSGYWVRDRGPCGKILYPPAVLTPLLDALAVM